MRNNYVGDIGDFANNGLLRVLCGTPDDPVPELKLGVVWYLNKSEDDYGNEIGYLNVSDHNDSLFGKCDPDPYDALRKIVGESLKNRTKRKIGQIERANILPCHLYVPDPLNNLPREEWFTRVLGQTAAKDLNLVFVNPDTGIANDKQAKADSLKHVKIDELIRLAGQGNGRSLIIYHQSRGQGIKIEDIARKLQAKLTINYQPRVWALQWHREQSRTYIVVAQPEHAEIFETRTKGLLDSPWGKKKPLRSVDPHFTLEYPPKDS